MRDKKHIEFLIKKFSKEFPDKEINNMAELNRVLLDDELKQLYIQQKKGKEND
tara:strand:+ start:1805 stop:1963 length:159 start_codon:yes stop_codon:yes gene_type:complete